MNTTPAPTPSYRTGKKIIKKRETVFYWLVPKVLGKELCVFRKNDPISLWKSCEVEEDHGEVAGVSQEPVRLGVRKKGRKGGGRKESGEGVRPAGQERAELSARLGVGLYSVLFFVPLCFHRSPPCPRGAGQLDSTRGLEWMLSVSECARVREIVCVCVCVCVCVSLERTSTS